MTFILPVETVMAWETWVSRKGYMITQADLDNWFTYHAPTPEQIPRYEAIRAGAKAFAQVILANTPSSADQSAAVRLVREATWTANAAIACAPSATGGAAVKERPHVSYEVIHAVAATLHEMNRIYCLYLGDASQPHWEDAPEWQKHSAVEGVIGILNGNTPEKSHEGWLALKVKDGWKFGPVKDETRKEHPCIMPYHELPPAQQQKDQLFVHVGRAMLEALR